MSLETGNYLFFNSHYPPAALHLGVEQCRIPLPALVYQLVLSFMLALFKQSADGDYCRDTQLVKMQKIIDCEVPNPN